MKKNGVLLLLLFVALKTEAQTSVFTVVDSLLLHGDYQTALITLKSEKTKNVKTYNAIGSIYQSGLHRVLSDESHSAKNVPTLEEGCWYR